MRYALTKTPDHATGLFDDDPAPFHLECEGPLVEPKARDGRWFCISCHKLGFLVLDKSQLDPAPPSPPTALHRMRQRWNEVWPGALDIPDLRSPRTWESFLKTYFARGVWLMRALDDAQNTVADDSFLYLGFDIGVGLGDAEGDLPEIAVLDAHSHHPRFLKNTMSIRQIDFGILLLTNDKGQHVRLDAHLTAEDERVVTLARDEYYGTSNPYEQHEDRS